MSDCMAGRKTILLVEDEVLIAMGEAALLDKEGYTVVLASTGESAIAEAAAKPIDLILMDINLGKGIDGTQATQEILKTHDIPIIFLSSHIEPDIVAKTERITSYGYVVKSPGITVLLASIKMAFKLHAANQALRHTNEILSLAQEASHAGAWDWDGSRGTFEWSPELRRLLGVGMETEASFSSWLQIVHPEDREKAAAMLQPAVQDRTDPVSDFRIILPNGEVRWIHSTAKINYVGDRPQRSVGLCVDITDIIQAEEALRSNEARFKAVVENSSDLIIFAKADGTILYRSPSHPLISGFSREEHGEHYSLEEFHPDDRQKILQYWNRIIQNPSQTQTDEFRMLHKNGSWVRVEMSAQNMLANPDIGAIVVSSRDITRRKQADEALRRSEAKFRAVVENSSDGILFCDPNGIVLYRSPSYTNINGYLPEERIGRNAMEIVHPDDYDRVGKLFRALLQAPGDSIRSEYRIRHKNGSWVWVEVSSQNLLANPDIEALVITVRDISRRKQAEEALRRSEAKFRAVVETSNDGILFGDAGAVISYRSPSYARINGYTDNERLGRSGFETVHPDDTAAVQAYWSSVTQSSGESLTAQYRIRHKDGSWRWIESTAVNQMNNQDIGEIVVTSRDITERKRMEAALRDSEEHHRLLFEHAGQAIYYFDADGNFLALNTAAAQSLGGQPADFIGKSLISIFGSQASAEYLRRLRAASETESSQQYEDQIQMPDGVHWSLSTHTRILNADGQVSGVQVIVLDITARKHTEIALIIKDRAIETSLNAIAIADLDGMLTYVNPAFLAMWGYSDPGEVLGRAAVDFWQSPERANEIRQAMLTQGQWVGELNSLRKDGIVLPMQLSTNLVTDAAGIPLCAQASFVDLSALKQAEHKARENENWYRSIIAALNEGIIVQDREMKIIASNQAAETILGVSSAQILGEIPNIPSWPLIHEDGKPFTEEDYPGLATLRSGQPQQNVIAGMHTPQAKQIWLSINSQPIWTPGEDRPSAVVNSFTDITQRLNAEEQLRRSQADLEEAQRVAHLGSWRFELPTNRVTWSDEMFRVFDLGKSEFSGDYDSFISRVHPDDRDMVCKNSATARETGAHFESEYRILSREGKIKNIRETGYAIKDDAGKVVGMFGTAQDITPLKQAEAMLQTALAEKDVLMHELQHRVKNSLATAASLLSLEAGNLPDVRSRAIFANTQNRLSSMAAVYEQLYSSGNLDRINLRNYIIDLTARLSEAYIPPGRQISIQARVDAVELDLRRTLPLGLILNELITNALKHAFPGGRPGEILIRLTRQGEQVTLDISDNGVGLSQGASSPSGVGLKLVRLLAQQIESQLTIDSGAGCSVHLIFSLT